MRQLTAWLMTCVMFVSVAAPATAAPSTPLLAFVSNGLSDTVSVLDTRTYQLIATIPVGDDPRGVAVSPDGRWVYVATLGADAVTVIDATTLTVAAVIAVADDPHWVVFSPDGEHAYVAHFTAMGAPVSVIDVATQSVVGALPHTSNAQHGLAMDPDGRIVYVVGAGPSEWCIYRVNVRTNVATAQRCFEPWRIHHAVVSRDGRTVWLAGDEGDWATLGYRGFVLELRARDLTVKSQTFVDPGAWGIEIENDGSTIYVSNNNCCDPGLTTDSVTAIDTATATITDVYTVGDTPNGIALNKRDRKLWVAEGNWDGANPGHVAVINLNTGQVVARIELDHSPVSVALQQRRP